MQNSKKNYSFYNWESAQYDIVSQEIKSAQRLSNSMFVVNGNFLIDLESGQFLDEDSLKKEFFPLQGALSWFLAQLLNWACPYVIEGSTKKAKTYIQQTFNPKIDTALRTQSQIYSENETLTFVPVIMSLFSVNTKKHLAACVGPECFDMLSASMGLIAKKFLASIDSKAHYVICADIFEDLLHELGDRLAVPKQ